MEVEVVHRNAQRCHFAEAGYVEQETKAIWDVFKTKRQLMLNGLTNLASVDAAPSGTFPYLG